MQQKLVENTRCNPPAGQLRDPEENQKSLIASVHFTQVGNNLAVCQFSSEVFSVLIGQARKLAEQSLK